MDLPELDDDDSLNPDASAAPAADEPSDVTASLVNKVPGVLPYLPRLEPTPSAPPGPPPPPGLPPRGSVAVDVAHATGNSGVISSTTNLPTDSQYTGQPSSPHIRGVVDERPFRDRAFIVLYVIALLVVLVTGITITVATKPLLDPVTGGLAYILYRSIQSSIGILCVLVAFECLLAAGWLWCMRYSAKLVEARRWQLCTWMTLLLIPLQLLMFGAWALRVQSSATLASFGAVAIVAGVVALLLAVRLSVRIETTIAVLQLASSVILENNAMVVVAAGAAVLFALITIAWLYLYAALLLVGYTVYGEPSWWALYPGSYWAQSFFYFFFFWTMALIGHIKLSTVAGTTFDWYFRRYVAWGMPARYERQVDRQTLGPADPTVLALKRAVTSSLGTLCLSALVLTVVRVVRITIDRIFRAIAGRESWWARLLSYFVMGVERLIVQVSAFVVIYSALTGRSFCTASREMNDLLRRNMLERFVIDFPAHFILYTWTTTVAALCALVVYSYHVQVTASPHAWIPTTLSFVITFGIMRFFVSLMLDVIDTLFVCYALDRDAGIGGDRTGLNPNIAVHDIMSKSLSADDAKASHASRGGEIESESLQV